MDTWVCYHVIGDALRGARTLSPGFSRRFAAMLAASRRCSRRDRG